MRPRDLRWSLVGALALGVVVYLVLPRFVGDAWRNVEPAPGGQGLLVLALVAQFASIGLFAALFAHGVRQGGLSLTATDAVRASLVGAAIIRLVPGGGAVAPAGMAWAMRRRWPGTAGEAVRAAVLSFGAMLLMCGAALVWVTLRRPDIVLAPAGTVAGLAGALAGTAILFAGPVNLSRIFRLARRFLGERVTVNIRPRPPSASEHLLLFGRWSVEAAALGLALAAFGVELDPVEVLVAFGLTQVASGVPVSPGGLGFAEAGLVGALALFGYEPTDTLGPVLVYRAISYWLPALSGLAAGAWSWGTSAGDAVATDGR